jgi:hypothetical protein
MTERRRVHLLIPDGDGTRLAVDADGRVPVLDLEFDAAHGLTTGAALDAALRGLTVASSIVEYVIDQTTDDTVVGGLMPRVHVLAEVLLGHRVDERIVGVVDDLGDRAADLEVAVGVLLVDDGQRHCRVGLQIAVLLATGGLAEQHVGAIPAEPHRVVLRQAVGADGGHVCEGGRFEDVGVRRGNGHDRANTCGGNDIPESVRFPRNRVVSWCGAC